MERSTARKLRAVADVVAISPAIAQEAVFRAMIRGFEAKCGSRGFDPQVAVQIVLRFSRWAAELFDAPYPWQWTRTMGEQWADQLWRLPADDGGRELVLVTAYSYQGAVRRFCEYICDGDYPEPSSPWTRQCEQQFGRAPIVIFDLLNSIKRSADPTARYTKRTPFSRELLLRIFTFLDDRVEAAKGKSKLPAARDSAMIKFFYAYGARNTEARLVVDPQDWSPSPEFPEYGRYGGVWIRNGKGANGSGPRERCIRTVPKFDWIVRVMHDYTQYVRPRLIGSSGSNALFPSDKNKKGFLNIGSVDDIWAKIREEMGIEERMKLHCFRHSYMTHLIEAGYPAKFIQIQAGHRHLGSMATYTSSLGDRFLSDTLRAAQQQILTPRTDPAEIDAVALEIPEDCWVP